MNIIQIVITLSLFLVLQGCKDNANKSTQEQTNSATDIPDSSDPNQGYTSTPESTDPHQGHTSTPGASAPLSPPVTVVETPLTDEIPQTTPSEISSDCAEDFQALNWDGSQLMNRLSFGEIPFNSKQIGQRIIPAYSGFTIGFPSPVYVKNWNRTSKNLPIGLNLKISEVLQYGQFRDLKLSTNDFIKDSVFNINSKNEPREISIVSFNLTSDFFIKNNLATKKLKFDLICKDKIYSTDMDFIIRSQVPSRIHDYYLLHPEGDRTLIAANGIKYKYMYVDRSIDGASIILSCSALSVKVGDPVQCTLQSDKIDIKSLQWKIDDKVNTELNGQSTLNLNSTVAGSTQIRVKATSTDGFPVSSNLITVIFK